jgi:tetratricopeptide (TPR) repeat protein
MDRRTPGNNTQIDQQPEDGQPAGASAGLRRPLWENMEWCRRLLDQLDGLAWCDHSGERVMRAAVPLLVEAICFNRLLAATIITVLEPAAAVWDSRHRQTFEVLKQGRRGNLWRATGETRRAILAALRPYQFSTLQQAILKLQTAALLISLDQLAAAAGAVDSAAGLMPAEGGELRESLGASYAQLGRRHLWSRNVHDALGSAEALDILHRATRYNPSDAKAWYFLGTAAAKADDPDQALEAFQHAIALAPDQAQPYHGLASVYADIERYDDAIAAYRQAITLNPDFAYAHNGLGLIYEHRRQFDQAISAYQRAIALDPTYAHPHRNLGDVYDKLRQYSRAAAAYRRAIAIEPGFADAHHGLGNMYRLLERYDDAIAAYRQAIALDPDDAYPQTGLGNIFSLLGEADTAEQHYRSALAIDPQAIGALISLSRLARQRGGREAAQTLIEQALALIAEDDLYDRACLESIAGNTDAALRLLQQAVDDDGTDRDWARTDPDFAFIRADPRFQALVSDEG